MAGNDPVNAAAGEASDGRGAHPGRDVALVAPRPAHPEPPADAPAGCLTPGLRHAHRRRPELPPDNRRRHTPKLDPGSNPLRSCRLTLRY